MTSDNEVVVILEAAAVLGMVWLLVYATMRQLARPPASQDSPVRAGNWRTAHYDVKGETRIVLQKVSAGGGELLDEHVIATVAVDDPEYDAKFLTAMSAARERRALFETEEDG